MRSKLSRTAASLLAMLLAFLVPVSAQEASSNYADNLPDVRDRYDGVGRHVGSFWLLPTLEMGGFYDSNVYALSEGQKDGSGVYVRPRLEAKSDWGRHALNLMLDMTHYEYLDETAQSRTNFEGAIDGRIDVRRNLVILGGLKGGLFEDEIGDVSTSSSAAEPTQHEDFVSWASVDKTFNRLSVSAGGIYKRYNYHDVASTPAFPGFPADIDQDFRDGDVYEAGGRVSYLFSPGYRWFGDFRYNWREYDNNLAESSGWRGLTGLEFELSRLLRGEVGVGYLDQYYDDGDTEGSFSYHAGLTWNPTPLVTVKLDADRNIQNTSIVGSSGSVEDKFKFGLDYEIRRSMILSPSFAIAFDDYQDIDRTALIYDAGVKLDYAMNRFLTVGASYVYTSSNIDDSTLSQGDYDRHVLGVHAKARF